jgi:hypothetical protein
VEILDFLVQRTLRQAAGESESLAIETTTLIRQVTELMGRASSVAPNNAKLWEVSRLPFSAKHA